MEKTIAQRATGQGIGLHSGDLTTVTIGPEDIGVGLYFVRTDLPGQPIPSTNNYIERLTVGIIGRISALENSELPFASPQTTFLAEVTGSNKPWRAGARKLSLQFIV